MKKIFGLFFILTILFFCSNMSFASFPAGELGTVDVVADFSGKGRVDFSFDLKEISVVIHATPASVYSQKSKAIKKMRSILNAA